MLQIKNLSVHYGGIHALQGIDLIVPEGKIVTLIGANGAGKSTTLRTIVGLAKPTAGTVLFDDKPISGKHTEEIVQMGIALVPEGRRIFPNLTVEENLLLGAYARTDKKAVLKDLDHTYELFPRLKERRMQKGGTLSGGEQQMLAVGRGLHVPPEIAHDG